MKALERHEQPPMEQVLAVVRADSSLRSERPMVCPQPKAMPRQSAPARSMPSSSPSTALAVVPPYPGRDAPRSKESPPQGQMPGSSAPSNVHPLSDTAPQMNPMPAPKDAKRARWHAVEAHLPASLPQMQPAPAVQQQTRADAGADTISVVDSMDGGKPLASPARSSGENLRGDPARLERTRGASGENQGSAGTANGSY